MDSGIYNRLPGWFFQILNLEFDTVKEHDGVVDADGIEFQVFVNLFVNNLTQSYDVTPPHTFFFRETPQGETTFAVNADYGVSRINVVPPARYLPETISDNRGSE